MRGIIYRRAGRSAPVLSRPSPTSHRERVAWTRRPGLTGFSESYAARTSFPDRLDVFADAALASTIGAVSMRDLAGTSLATGRPNRNSCANSILRKTHGH